MAHQTDPKPEVKVIEGDFKDHVVKEVNLHPFFEKNDITLLSMVSPLLSSSAQRLITFFINFGNSEPVNPLGSMSDFLQQGSNKQQNSLMELAPALLGMLSGDSKGNGSGGLNPALLSTLLSSFMNNKKED